MDVGELEYALKTPNDFTYIRRDNGHLYSTNPHGFLEFFRGEYGILLAWSRKDAIRLFDFIRYGLF